MASTDRERKALEESERRKRETVLFHQLQTSLGLAASATRAEILAAAIETVDLWNAHCRRSSSNSHESPTSILLDEDALEGRSGSKKKRPRLDRGGDPDVPELASHRVIRVCPSCLQEKNRVYKYQGASKPFCSACAQHWKRNNHGSECPICSRLLEFGAARPNDSPPPSTQAVAAVAHAEPSEAPHEPVETVLHEMSDSDAWLAELNGTVDSLGAAMWDLLIPQLSALDEMKQICAAEISVEPTRFTDAYLERFLRRQNGDALAAATMFQTHVRWYVENRIATIVPDVESDPEMRWLRREFPLDNYPGTDKDGCPVFYDRPSQMHVDIFARYTPQQIRRYVTYVCEKAWIRAREQSALLQKNIDQGVMIIDMCELGWYQVYNVSKMLSVMTPLVELEAHHYPECVKNILVINAPRVHGLLFKLMQPFMTPQLITLQEIHGQDFRARLLTQFSQQNLPLEWGGSCTIPLKSTRRSDSSTSRTVTVLTSLEVPIEVAVPGSWVSYEFRASSNDISFGVLKGADRTAFLPLERYECGAQPCQGRFQVHESGTYLLVFDNGFSVFRAKKVTYEVFVHTPTDVALSLELSSI